MPKLLRKSGYFDLFGLDFMVETVGNETSRSHRIILLEVNTNPALSLGKVTHASNVTILLYLSNLLLLLDNSTLEKLLPSVVDSTIDIVLRTQDSAAAMASTIPPHGNFRLIYDERTGFEYTEKGTC